MLCSPQKRPDVDGSTLHTSGPDKTGRKPMKKQLSLLVLGLVLGIVLAACGGNSDMGGMNMNGATPTATSDMGGMNMGGTPTANSNAPFDAQFIDGMIKHHQGAIDMAKEAQTKA